MVSTLTLNASSGPEPPATTRDVESLADSGGGRTSAAFPGLLPTAAFRRSTVAPRCSADIAATFCSSERKSSGCGSHAITRPRHPAAIAASITV